VSKCTGGKRDHCTLGVATINAAAQATTTKLKQQLKQTKKALANKKS